MYLHDVRATLGHPPSTWFMPWLMKSALTVFTCPQARQGSQAILEKYHKKQLFLMRASLSRAGVDLVTSCDQRLNSGHILEPFKMHNSNFPPTYLKKVFYKKLPNFYY